MKKIGLFLGSEASNGGMFQYSQAVLDATASLPNSKFSAVVAYTNTQWEPYLKSYKLKSLHIENAGGRFSLCNIWRTTGLPIVLWRNVAPYFNSVAKTLAHAQCDLWIFPAHDPWSYMMPVTSLASIHDLMHRYERSFPEVSAHGGYHRRERLFRN